MIISFDIDNTLIPYSNEFEVERMTLFSRLFKAEPIRKGTIELFKVLEERGHQIWIYTTSFRTKFNLNKTIKLYGLNPSNIINQNQNQKILLYHRCNASKNPGLFGIDVHIDDSKGVEIEGRNYGFKTIIVNPDDPEWAIKILKGILDFEENKD